MDQTTESTIIAECRQGDWSNFRQLYDEYLPKIYRYLYYRVRHKETAQDLSSGVFIKAVQALPQVKPGTVLLGPWLYRIAHNALVDHIRAQRPVYGLDEAFDVASSTDVAADTKDALDLEAVRMEVKNLSDLQREVVELRVWDELSHREIGEVLGVSETSAKVAFSRAMENLKQRINI